MMFGCAPVPRPQQRPRRSSRSGSVPVARAVRPCRLLAHGPDGQLHHFEESRGPNQIDRYQRQAQVTVDRNLRITH